MHKRVLFMLFVICVLALTGCSSVTSEKQNAMEVGKKGKITASSYSTFDKEYYDEKELKEQIQSAINQYNDQIESDNIKLKKCRRDDGGVHVVLSYSSAEDYKAFNGVICYTGKLQNALGAETVEGSDVVVSRDGALKTTISELNMKEGADLDLLIVEEPMVIKVPKDILYIHGNVEITGKNTCVTGAGSTDDMLLDSPCYILYGKK